jgi:hypothetical protein
MADEVFRPKRPQIAPEEFQDFGQGIDENPLNKVLETQRAVAADMGMEPPTMPNPDSPFQISGKMPEQMKQMFMKGGATPPKTPPKARPIPNPGEEPSRNVGSDAFESLLARLEPHMTWEQIELPSRGKFYDDIPGVLHVRPMTGQEEQILAQQRLVKKGRSIDMIFEKCIRENVRPEELLAVDRTYILVFLRGISYTPEYDVEIKCPECQKAFNTTINLGSLPVDPCPDDFGPADLSGVLPTTGFSFRYRLANGADEITAHNYREARIKEYGTNAEDDSGIFRTSLLLEEIEGVTEKKELSVLLKRLPVSDLVHLRQVISEPPFGVETEIDVNCEFCYHEFTVELPFEASFFSPRKKTEQTRR